MSGCTWKTLDWAVLDRLRDGFLAGERPAKSYWTCAADLAQYDFTFGRRIGWKWDSALGELLERGWRLPVATVIDWGCGSGTAGRRVAAFASAGGVKRLLLHDRSRAAVDYATAAAREALPGVEVEPCAELSPDRAEAAVLVVSHVLGELAGPDLAGLLSLASRAAAVLWVEPGTRELSRALGAVREDLRGAFRPVAPCTHGGACGMLDPGKERHWCHFFAAVPAGVMNDAGWVRFAQRAGIDLRSLPYSFFALERRAGPEPGGAATGPEDFRLIGASRVHTGYAKILACGAAGVRELRLLKRDDPALYRRLRKDEGPRTCRWTVDGDRALPAGDVLP